MRWMRKKWVARWVSVGAPYPLFNTLRPAMSGRTGRCRAGSSQTPCNEFSRVFAASCGSGRVSPPLQCNESDPCLMHVHTPGGRTPAWRASHGQAISVVVHAQDIVAALLRGEGRGDDTI